MASPTENAAARAFVNDNLTLDTGALKTALGQVYGDSYVAGQYVAAQQTGANVIAGLGDAPVPPDWGTFWDTWKPGNAGAASLLSDGAFARLLEQQDITVKGIEGTTLDRLGNALADGVSRGLSVDEIAGNLADYVDNPVRAFAIANTETARATSAAAMDGYVAAGIAQIDWLVSPGACEECEDIASGGPFTLQDAPMQPAHPSCRCAYAPVDPGTASPLAPTGAAAGYSPEEMNTLRNYVQGSDDAPWANNINGELRGGKDLDGVSYEMSAEQRTAIPVLDGMMEPLPSDQTLYRILDPKGMSSASEREWANARPGSILSDKGFLSAADDQNYMLTVAREDMGLDRAYTMEIHVPAGTNAIDVGDIGSVYGNQGEYILPRGTSLEVRSVEPGLLPGGGRNLVMDVVDRAEGNIVRDFANPDSPAVYKGDWTYDDGTVIRAASMSPENTRALYKLPTSEKLDSSFADWGASLSQSERGALTEYQIGQAFEINHGLRSGGELISSLQERVQSLDSAISSGSAPQAMVVYRGMGMDSDLLKGLKVGDRITDQGFVSTAIDRETAIDFTETGTANEMFAIQIPKGSPMAWVNSGSDYQMMEQGEILLPRGGQFIYTGIDKTTGMRVLRFEAPK